MMDPKSIYTRRMDKKGRDKKDRSEMQLKFLPQEAGCKRGTSLKKQVMNDVWDIMNWRC